MKHYSRSGTDPLHPVQLVDDAIDNSEWTQRKHGQPNIYLDTGMSRLP